MYVHPALREYSVRQHGIIPEHTGWRVYTCPLKMLYSREALPHLQPRQVPPWGCPGPLTGWGGVARCLALGWAVGRSGGHQEPLWGCTLCLSIAGHCACLCAALRGSGAALCWLWVGSVVALHGAALPVLVRVLCRYCAYPVQSLCRVPGAHWKSTGLSPDCLPVLLV